MILTTLQHMVEVLREHPEATILCADGAGPQLLEGETEEPEDFDSYLGWIIFWEDGDNEHFKEFKILLRAIPDDDSPDCELMQQFRAGDRLGFLAYLRAEANVAVPQNNDIRGQALLLTRSIRS